MYRDLFVLFVLSVLYTRIDTKVERCVPPEWFQCKQNSKCISFTFRCDGENDCDDNSDEEGCQGYEIDPETIRCATDEFQCTDRFCIPVEKFCDAKSDCPDASDEYDGCVKELKCDTFRCNSGHCVRNEWVCDGVSDCIDNSDENNCEDKAVPIDKCNNEYGRYLCENQRCIALNATCNERNDCGDNSDENIDECKKAETSCEQTAKCEHNCWNTPKGAQCSCRNGYELLNNQTCQDVNECDIYGTCDQQCTNNAGSYSCFCQSGYTLNDDKKTCKTEGGEASLIFSIKSEIHGYYLDSKIYYIVTRNLQHAVAVSLDANYVYWSDTENNNEAIIKTLDNGSQREVIVTTGLSKPQDMAVDWVTGNIYFTDSGYMHIGVCNNDGSYCTAIIKERREPRGLALFPSTGTMYWTEGDSNSRILMAGMDGKNSSILYDQDLEWPSSLSIDYANNRLYWIDAKQRVIESIRMDGTDRRTILKGIAKRPFSLAVFEDKLYWSDWISNSIQSCDKFTGKDWKILLETNSTIYGIHIYHSVLKPKIPNPCNSNPCSQLCLLNSVDSYTCACTLDKELNHDKHTCRSVKKETHLIIAAGSHFIDYYHELLGKPNMTTITTLKHITAVSYNPLTGSLLASDQLTDTIFQYDTHTGELNSLLSIENDDLLGGMDFDYMANNLYLSDLKHKTIEVHSLDTKGRTIFYFQEEPHDIALVPEESTMMVVFHSDGKYRIDMMNMNGLGARIPIAGDKMRLVGPKISLCYDRDMKRLFWSDQGTGNIGTAKIPGLEKQIFRTGLTGPVSLAVVGDHVFWTQLNSNQLYWTSKSYTQQYQKRITLEVPSNLDRMQLVGLHGTYVNMHKCRENNGNCSHVCLLSKSRSHICACPPSMMLNPDNRTCSFQTACKPEEMKCGEHDVCIKLEQRCDGAQDCPNGEDESSNCEEHHWSKCKDQEQFQCKNGECISATKRCNSHYDCADRSDEESCDKKECNSNEFQCYEGACISKYLVCNGQNDCTDFSDEFNCGRHDCDAQNFKCESGGCIPITWKCDGEADCQDGSDENDMCLKKECPSEMFTCSTTGRCIDFALKCNGINDCEDESDEQYCRGSNNNNANCTADEYKCFNTEMCLPKRVRCNGLQDCPKNDDERNCARCQDTEYVCDNQKCVDKRWVCDGSNDCGDGSDERDCDGRTSNSRTIDVSANSNCKEFKCSNGVCLPFDKVCDGKVDCSDRSDEFGECSISCTRNNPCEAKCLRTPSGPVCGCMSGYRLSSDLKSCEDIDECKDNVCSQICRNTNGSFTCSCYEGYVIRSDKTSCKAAGPQMELITVTGNDIRKISANLKSIEIVYEETNSEISGIDVNAREGTIYWSNDIFGTISKVDMKSKKRKTVTGLDRPEALAVDWITNNVYFNDNDHLSTIQVCNLEEQKCAKLISMKPRSRATAIVVEPTKGWLFWSQTTWVMYDRPTTDIYRSNTTGTNASAIVYENLGVVFALTIDYTRSKLYWADTFFKKIETSNLDGSNRALFLNTGVHQPLSISVYGDFLYWLVGTTGTVKKCQLYGEKSCITIPIGNSNVDKYFSILHTARQLNAKNFCENHKCSHMCVSRNDGPACICHNGYPTNPKGICPEDVHTKLKFDSSVISRKDVRHSGAVIGVIITLVAFMVIALAYFYYQKVNFSKKNSLSIHFQNPSYDQHCENTFDCISGLPPGEHEYVNPVMDIQNSISSKKHQGSKMEKTVQINEMKIIDFDGPNE